MCDSEDGYVIRARGLPWSCTKEEVQEFFKGANIKGGLEGIKFTFTDEGRPSGECFVELLSKEDVEEAMKKHTQNMGHRYVEVFASKISEMEWVTKRSGSTSLKNNDGWLRLRGLPFDAGNVEIAQFFGDLEIVTNTITFLQDHQLRNTGEAYVQFASKEIAEKALEKNKQTMGHRYIEIFRSSQDEVMRAKRMNSRGFIGGGRPGPYDRFGGGGGGYGGRGFGGGPRSGFERRYRGDQGWSGGGYEEDFGFSGGYGGGPGAGWFNRRGGMGMGMRGAGRGGAGGGGRGGFGRMLGMFGGGGGGGGAGGGGGGGGRGSGFGGGDGQDFESDTGHAVFMRGLPFKVDDDAIREWFRGTANPVSVYIHKNDMGRNTGNAHVEFATHTEALAAMSKDKKNMAHRYIELFLKSEPDDTTGGYGSSNTSGMGGGTGSYGTNSGSGYGMGGSGAGFTQQSNMMSGNTGYTSFGSTGGYGQGDGSAGGGYDGYNNSGMGMGGGDDYTY